MKIIVTFEGDRVADIVFESDDLAALRAIAQLYLQDLDTLHVSPLNPDDFSGLPNR